MIFRILGIISVMTGCLGIVLAREKSRKERIDLLEQMEIIIDVFEKGIEYFLSTMEECACSAAVATGEPFHTALLEIGEGNWMKLGLSFPEAFSLIMGKALEKTSISKEDMKLFFSFLVRDSSQPREGLVLGMKFTKEKIRNRRLDLEQKLEGKRRVELGVGVLGGLFLIVILL